MATTTGTYNSAVAAGELGRHKSRQDLWVAVHGKVYDLTAFAEDHPGGIEVLVECAGTDATESFDFAGHTAEAIEAMQRFLVADDADHAASPPPRASAASRTTTTSRTGEVATSKAAERGAAGLDRTTPRTLLLRPWSLAASLAVFAASVLLGVRRYGTRESSEAGVKIPDGSGGNLLRAVCVALVLSFSLGCAGFGYLYRQFGKTLKRERDVFSYPPVIPRVVRR